MLIPFAMPIEIYQPVRDARRAWERTQPQLTLDLDPEDLPGVSSLPRGREGVTLPGEPQRRPAAPGRTTN